MISILGNCEDGCAQTRNERILSYLLGPTKESNWTATKLLAKDPRVAVPNRKRALCFKSEPVKPEQESYDFFDEKRSTHKIILAEKLFDLATEKDLQ